MGENRWLRNSLVYLVILVMALVLIYNYISDGGRPTEERPISTVIADSLDGDVKKIEGHEGDNRLEVTYFAEGTNPEKTYISRKTDDMDLAGLLQQQKFQQQQLAIARGEEVNTKPLPEVVIEPAPAWGSLIGAFTFLLPTLLIIGFFIFFMRQAQGSNNQALSFGKSRARMFTGDKPTVTFADVAGQEEAKQDLTEVVEFLKFPEKFAQLGARIPRGVLMIGPPGTGKTLLSRAVAGEAGVPFFSISGSEFVEMFVGVGASRVRDLFDQAKRNAPCLIFIDEVDAVGRQRGAGLGGSHDEREQTLNQILVEMDGFDTNTNVIVIAATNRPDVLDPALIRPGRFDRQVTLDNPDVRGRLEILKVHTRGKPLDSDVNLEVIAKMTPGSSGADLANIVNEAAILSARRSKKKIGMPEFEDATDRLLLGGPERRSRVMTPREKEITAYHEAGHAIVGQAMPNGYPVHKVTIVPRGRAGGYTLFLPQEDQSFQSVSEFESRLASAMGGRAAEEIVFGDYTTGAQGDIQMVTRIARAMVTRFGMSEELGPISFGEKEELIFLGREISEQRNYSDKTARVIDAEVKRLVSQGHHRARFILEQNREILDRMAEALIEYETLDGERMMDFLNRVKAFDPQANGQYAAPKQQNPASA